MQIRDLTAASLAAMFDHTNLKAFASSEDIRRLCAEARRYGFAAVAVNDAQTALCSELLKGSGVKVGTCIGFPLGQNTIGNKVLSAVQAIEGGAGEIDYVANLTFVKDGDWDKAEEEMTDIARACHDRGALCKVIFENCYLTKEEIRRLAEISLRARPDFIKTSTGFGTGGATVEDVALMKSVVGDAVQIKAAGGIRDWATCRAMIEAGATRIGTSAAIAILQQFNAK
jgi:deoxyribose-phosphate aldolase